MDQDQYIIKAQGISKSFGKVKALDSVDLFAKKGEVMALLGPNGAGKTTLIRILTTLMKPDSGKAEILGFDAARQASDLRSQIGLSGQYAAIDENLTGKENLELFATLYHMPAKEGKKRTADLLDQFGLTDAKDRTAKTYSGGMRRRLDLAASLIGNPKILFLDEPTTGLDPKSRIDLWQEIKSLVRSGMTLLLTTQYLEEAERLADQITVIDRGHIIATGTVKELKSKVGYDILELHVLPKSKTREAAEVLSSLEKIKPQFDEENGKIILSASHGAKIIGDVIRLLDSIDTQIDDITLHHPTLDDVFLTLTGEKTQEETTQNKKEDILWH